MEWTYVFVPSCKDSNCRTRLIVIHSAVDFVPYTLHMESCLVVGVDARLGTQYSLWPSTDQQQWLLVFPAVCPSAPYTSTPPPLPPSRAGVCIVTVDKRPRIRTEHIKLRGIYTIMKGCFLKFGCILIRAGWKRQRKVDCLMSHIDCQVYFERMCGWNVYMQ